MELTKNLLCGIAVVLVIVTLMRYSLLAFSASFGSNPASLCMNVANPFHSKSGLMVSPDGSMVSSQLHGLISGGADLRTFSRRTDGSGGDVVSPFLDGYQSADCGCGCGGSGGCGSGLEEQLSNGIRGRAEGFSKKSKVSSGQMLEKAMKGY